MNRDYFTEGGLIKEDYGFHNRRNTRFRDYLCSMDAYGFEKITAENILIKSWKDKHDYFIFRLPDVIGPFDDSARFWVIVLKIQAMIELSKGKNEEDKDQFNILKFKFDEEEENDEMSIVWSDDISNIIDIILVNSKGSFYN